MATTAVPDREDLKGQGPLDKDNMTNLESIKIHTMQDDLPAALTGLPTGQAGPPTGQTSHPTIKARQSVSNHSRQNKSSSSDSRIFPLPTRPNNSTLYLPAKSKKIQHHPALWFIISAAVLLILNVIIWSIAIIR